VPRLPVPPRTPGPRRPPLSEPQCDRLRPGVEEVSPRRGGRSPRPQIATSRRLGMSTGALRHRLLRRQPWSPRPRCRQPAHSRGNDGPRSATGLVTEGRCSRRQG
jgi:hypothetical protein